MLTWSTQLGLKRCPHCNAQSAEFLEVSQRGRQTEDGRVLRVDRLYKCGACGGLVWASEPAGVESRPASAAPDRFSR